MLELIRAVGGLIKTSFAIVAGLALLAFFWGLAKFLFINDGEEKTIEEGRRVMTWGVIALFVMVSVWGLVAFIQEAFNLPSAPPSSGISI